MKFIEKFGWHKRSKKLQRSGNNLQHEGLIIANQLIDSLTLPKSKILLGGQLTHTQLATKLLELQIETSSQNILKSGTALAKKILLKLQPDKFTITRFLKSLNLEFKQDDWEIAISYVQDPHSIAQRAWVRDFLLNEIGPAHIAKLSTLIRAGIRTDSAFAEILKNWVPDNMALQRLVSFQLHDPLDKPLVKLEIINKDKTFFIYENGKWVKK